MSIIVKPNDFQVKLAIYENGAAIDNPIKYDFVRNYKVRTPSGAIKGNYPVSYLNGVYTNCKVIDNSLIAIFVDHDLPFGELISNHSWKIPADTNKGYLLIGEQDKDAPAYVNAEFLTIQGARGLQGIKGDKGDKGDTPDVSQIEDKANQALSQVSDLSNTLTGRIDAIVGENASSAIDNFNEILKFLEGIKDEESLTALLVGINDGIASTETKVNDIVTSSKNLFDKNSICPGYVNVTTGAVAIATDSYVSPIIPVAGGLMYYLSGRNCKTTELRFLDGVGNILKPLNADTGQSKSTFALDYMTGKVLAPQSAVSVQFTVRVNGAGTVDDVQFENGEKQTNYAEYGYIINDKAISGSAIEKKLVDISQIVNSANNKVEVILSSSIFKRENAGENTNTPQYFSLRAVGPNAPEVAFSVDIESPFKDTLPFKRIMSYVLSGTPTSLYVGDDLRIGLNRPNIMTVSYWVKESEIRAIWSRYMEAYLALGVYRYDVVNLLNNLGSKQIVRVTPNIDQYSKGVLTVYFAEKQDDFVKLVQEFEITWKDTFTGLTIPYFFIFNGVSSKLRDNPLSIYNLTILFGSINNGVLIYGDPDDGYIANPNNLSSLQHQINSTNQELSEIWDAISGNSENCRVQVIDEELYFASPFSSTQELVRMINIKRDGGFTSNPNVNLVGTYLTSKGGALNSGTFVKGSGDDICPARLGGYIGGNHGLNGAARTLTLSNHGKTYADIGSRWRDSNLRLFTILRIVDENTLWICSDNVYTDEYISNYVSPVGTLSYFENGTNTVSMTGFTTTIIENLYNTIIENKRKVIVDGQTELDVSNSAIVSCSHIDIVEDYDVLHLPSVLSALTANRPSSGYTENVVLNSVGGEKQFNHNITYRLLANGTTLVFHNFITYLKLRFHSHGFIQSSPIPGKLYMPKGLPLSDGSKTWDFRKIETWSPYPTAALLYTPEYWENAQSPPDRLVNFNNNIGLHLGYLFDRGVGKLRRNDSGAYLKRSMFLNTTGKLYPDGIYMENKNVEPNFFFSCVAFRSWFNPGNNPPERTNFTWFELDGKVFMYLDYNDTIRDIISMPAKWHGKSIVVNEKTNNVIVLGDTVANELQVICTVDKSNIYGYAVIVLE